MTERSVEHSSFSIERTYAASPARVFAAWGDAEAKARWFSGPAEWESSPHELDFRVGGREANVGGPKGGPILTYTALYWDIIPDERIVYTYEMLMDGTRISVSLVTIEFESDGSGTRLTLTEHGAFLDGHEPPPLREQGMGSLLDALGEVLRGA